MNFMSVARRMMFASSLAALANSAMAAPSAYQLQVDGLACPFCAYGLEKKLGEVNGVESLKTNVRDGTVTVTMKDGVPLDEASARKVVKEAGFSLRRFEAEQPAPQGQAGGRK